MTLSPTTQYENAKSYDISNTAIRSIKTFWLAMLEKDWSLSITTATLTFALLNVVARIPGTSISAYYIVAPAIGVYFVLNSPQVWRRIAVFAGIVAYGWLAGFIYGTPLHWMAKQTAFYVLAFLIVETVVFGTTRPIPQTARFTRLLDVFFATVAFIVQCSWS